MQTKWVENKGGQKRNSWGFRKQGLWKRLRTICNYLGWMFCLRQLRKKINQTWRVAILVCYAEYLAYIAHASEFLVAKPVSCLMSCGCLGQVLHNGIPPWNKTLELGQLCCCWSDHCIGSQRTTMEFWVSDLGWRMIRAHPVVLGRMWYLVPLTRK